MELRSQRQTQLGFRFSVVVLLTAALAASACDTSRHLDTLLPATEGEVTRLGPELRQVALTAVPEGWRQLVLREVEDRDLGVLFEHSSDRDAIRMAAFTSPEVR